MDLIGRTCSPATQVKKMDRVSDTELIGMGWSSDEITGVTVDGLWEALVYKARKPAEFLDVTDVQVEDRRGFLWRKMTVAVSKKTVVEHIYCSERKGEMIYRVVDAATGRESDDERVISVKKDPLRLEFFHRHATDGYRSYWAAPTKVVSTLVNGIVGLGLKLETNNSANVGLGVHSKPIEGVSVDAMWKAMLTCIREPARFMKIKVVKISDNDGYLTRTVSAGDKTVTDNIYVDEKSREIVYRLLDKDGEESDVERVVALRTHPMQVEFHSRSTKDGFRLDWSVPKAVTLAVVEAYRSEAQKMDKLKPDIIGYGISSDAIEGVEYDSILIAVDRTILNPGLLHDVDESATMIREEDGYLVRRYKLKANGVLVTEKVVIDEEAGIISFCKYNADGSEGPNERVLAIHQDPLRLEYYERKRSDGTRFSWTAPYNIAEQTMTKMIEQAKKIQNTSNDVIGYGISSKPMKGCAEDNLWNAMLFCIRNPQRSGMNVSNVQVYDNEGWMTRFMTIRDKKDKPQIIDNIYVDEEAREIKYRLLELERGGESADERVFAVRKAPLRCEMWCRHSKDQLRVHWKAPKSVAQSVFDTVAEIGTLMTKDRKAFQKKYAQGMDDEKKESS